MFFRPELDLGSLSGYVPFYCGVGMPCAAYFVASRPILETTDKKTAGSQAGAQAEPDTER